MRGDVSLGVGQYVTVWALIALGIVAVIGWILGAGAGGVLVFFALGFLGIMVVYAVAVRVYQRMLYGRRGGSRD